MEKQKNYSLIFMVVGVMIVLMTISITTWKNTVNINELQEMTAHIQKNTAVKVNEYDQLCSDVCHDAEVVDNITSSVKAATGLNLKSVLTGLFLILNISQK